LLSVLAQSPSNSQLFVALGREAIHSKNFERRAEHSGNIPITEPVLERWELPQRSSHSPSFGFTTEVLV
jgi:hypothetical protein